MSILHIKVTIDALVLRGFAPEQRQALAAGLRAELGRLLTGPQDAAALGESRSITHLHGGKLETSAEASPRRIGSLAARRIVQGVKP